MVLWFDFGAKLAQFWFQKSSKILPKKSIPRGINFLIDFYMDFLSIFDRFWKPTWGQVGHIFVQNWGSVSKTTPFFLRSVLFFDLRAFPAPSWLHFGRVGARFFDFWIDLGGEFGRFWGLVWRLLVTTRVLCA